jgi:hypothetical protein
MTVLPNDLDPLGEAYRCFDRWLKEHDPDGSMDIVDAAFAYHRWAETNSVERYLDAAQMNGGSSCNG